MDILASGAACMHQDGNKKKMTLTACRTMAVQSHAINLGSVMLRLCTFERLMEYAQILAGLPLTV